ncbi:uncharacterized protein LOC110654984 isoform X2 [Hevea brasiliensis]|uniref:uncharacterized protein LOC110654984 isoform X2 n=1 Tax=Hevea brasiliensis TaxID=3981 RepID=UPI0025E8F8B8|nr:uncharacterized protein LOC110654984 isoform X2 [Hevea brasiliensis]XP_057999507.1 uncharacterized protein LOC110654984 isoform X2 [Hevea brasiliensis]XP_057999508.1 uncharacterized protein LOC110654984 isoform X2 [Hevea brasiliensis]
MGMVRRMHQLLVGAYLRSQFGCEEEQKFHVASRGGLNARRENGIRVLSNDTHLESSRGRDPSAALESLMEKPVAMKLLLTSQGKEDLGNLQMDLILEPAVMEQQINAIQESCLVKVDELLKIKQKQDQDKAAVRLHSLNYNVNKGAISSSKSKGAKSS